MLKKKSRPQKAGPHTPSIALVGNPNVGKSAIFNLLTGSYVIVSNYPGTTVEVSRGTCKGIDGRVEVIDTPGVNNLIPQSEDERVARDILLRGGGATPDKGHRRVVQVADAKNLRRALFLTSQLAEMGLPVVLDLNMWDECLERGISIDTGKLQSLLGIPVVRTVATEKQGIGHLLNALPQADVPSLKVDFGREIEEGISRIEPLIPNGYPRRAMALMLLSGDLTVAEKLGYSKTVQGEVSKIRNSIQRKFSDPLSYAINRIRAAYVERLFQETVYTAPKRMESHPFLRASFFFFFVPVFAFALGYKIMDMLLFFFQGYLSSAPPLGLILKLVSGMASCILFCLHLYRKDLRTKRTISEVLGDLTMHPVAAYPILITALWAIYKLVGVFGAGVCVDFMEKKVFGYAGTPSGGFDLWFPVPFAGKDVTLFHVPFNGINYYLGLLGQMLVSPQNLGYQLFLDGQAGLIQVGLTYAIAIVFPIVGFFFLAFGLMEDSGYLPRLAVMLDKLFKRIGLTGKAVLPMVLGLGCGTMATLTTRILDTRKERIIATLLMALAIPCSAQLGVIAFVMGSISGFYFALYVFIIASQLILVGFVASKILPGGRSDFIMEVPPFRCPKLYNILLKTAYRVKWFLREAVPLFLIGTFARCSRSKTGAVKDIELAGRPVVSNWLGLPPETAEGFILGFLRRDYGAVSLFKALERVHGSVGAEPAQLLVALVVITLFVPCLANFLVIIKERGIATAALIIGFIVPYAFLVGGVLNLIMKTF
ncbi:MAG TPA: FeoB small GTPase domain-containing protein [Candidatus Tripitaka californicus]|uniref:FeoB small GTPase domain-containing protein n=1 Tax=Candidatus Tripitaka californicus TaxID=3367616 RepID=UPI004026B740